MRYFDDPDDTAPSMNDALVNNSGPANNFHRPVMPSTSSCMSTPRAAVGQPLYAHHRHHQTPTMAHIDDSNGVEYLHNTLDAPYSPPRATVAPRLSTDSGYQWSARKPRRDRKRGIRSVDYGDDAQQDMTVSSSTPCQCSGTPTHQRVDHPRQSWQASPNDDDRDSLDEIRDAAEEDNDPLDRLIRLSAQMLHFGQSILETTERGTLAQLSQTRSTDSYEAALRSHLDSLEAQERIVSLASDQAHRMLHGDNVVASAAIPPRVKQKRPPPLLARHIASSSEHFARPRTMRVCADVHSPALSAASAHQRPSLNVIQSDLTSPDTEDSASSRFWASSSSTTTAESSAAEALIEHKPAANRTASGSAAYNMLSRFAAVPLTSPISPADADQAEAVDVATLSASKSRPPLLSLARSVPANVQHSPSESETSHLTLSRSSRGGLDSALAVDKLRKLAIDADEPPPIAGVKQLGHKPSYSGSFFRWTGWASGTATPVSEASPSNVKDSPTTTRTPEVHVSSIPIKNKSLSPSARALLRQQASRSSLYRASISTTKVHVSRPSSPLAVNNASVAS